MNAAAAIKAFGARRGPRSARSRRLTVLAGFAAVSVTAWLGVQPASADAIGFQSIGRTTIAWTVDGIYVGFIAPDGHVTIGGNSGLWSVETSDTAPGHTGPALAAAGPGVMLAWAGTDQQHHIWAGFYDGTSSNACHTELPEETTHSPYLISSRGGDTVYMAFTGTDNHVNIATLDVSGCDPGGSGQIRETAKTTLSDTSVAGPGITYAPGDGQELAVAWSGTDQVRHIYTGIWTIGSTSSTLGNHTCLCNYASYADIGMDAPNSHLVLMAYTGTNNGINIASSSNGYTYPVQTNDGNNTSLVTNGPDVTDNGTDYYDDFTGTDGQVNVNSHSLN